MATLVSTGQITIVDTNDTAPITAYITASNGLQQLYSKDNSSEIWTPNWKTATGGTNNVLTAKVFVGQNDVTSSLTNMRWDLSTPAPTSAALGTSSTYTVTDNLTINNNVTYYFTATYTDPYTTVATNVMAFIQLTINRVGSNATYVLVRGRQDIEQAQGTTKNVAYVQALLVRASGVDTDNLTFEWYYNNGTSKIWNTAPINTYFGLKTVATSSMPSGSDTDIGVGLPAATGDWVAHNTLVISEKGITDLDVFKVVVKDSVDNVQAEATFEITDFSDPYSVEFISSTGNQFKQGVGSTTITPILYYGATEVTGTALNNFGFEWRLGNKDGVYCGFVDATKTPVGSGRTITATTSGAGGTSNITFTGGTLQFSTGQMCKVVMPDKTARYYEVGTNATSASHTLRTAVTTTSLNSTWPVTSIAASGLNGATLYACVDNVSAGATNQGARYTTGNTPITVTGDDVDYKGIITCKAYQIL